MSTNPNDILDSLTNQLGQSVNGLGSNNAEKKIMQAKLMASVMDGEKPKSSIASTVGYGVVGGLANLLANANNYNVSDNDAFFQGMIKGGLAGFDKSQQARQKWEEQAHENNRAVYKTILEDQLKQPETQAKMLYYASNSLEGLTKVGQSLNTGNAQVNDINIAREAIGLPVFNNQNGYGISDAGYKSIGETTGNTQFSILSPKIEARLKKNNENSFNQYLNGGGGNTGSQSIVKNGVHVNSVSGGIEENSAVPVFISQSTQKGLIDKAVDSNLNSIKSGTEQKEKITHNRNTEKETNRHNTVGEYNQTRNVSSEIGRRNVQNNYTFQQMDKNIHPEKYPLLKADLDKKKSKDEQAKQLTDIKSKLSAYGDYKPEALDLHADYIQNSSSYTKEERQKLRQVIKSRTGIDPEASYKYLIKPAKENSSSSEMKKMFENSK